MATFGFIPEFRRLHTKAKIGALTPTEHLEYENARAQFARLVIVSQQLGHAGETLRSTLRMAKVLKVDLRPDGGEALRLSTIDVASRGFAVLMPMGLERGTGSGFALHLPAAPGASANTIAGRCIVASSRAMTTLFRVSFTFDELDPVLQERLNIVLIDAVLERFDRSTS